jgi:acetyltransferase-like isoleucine patch superfamily enzyme
MALVDVKGVLAGYSVGQLFVRFAEEYLWWIIRSWPGFEGVYARYLFLKITCRRLDGFCWIAQGCSIVNSHSLSIGKGFATSRNVMIDALGGIEIGDDTGIGPNTVILALEHRMISPGGPFGPTARRQQPVRIGSRVWIGANCFIKAGVTVGDDAVVGACSNVVADVPMHGRVIGSPARSYFEVARDMAARTRRTAGTGATRT